MPKSPFETVEQARDYMKRQEHGRRLRSEEDVTALVRAVEHGFAVGRSAKLAFALSDILDPLLKTRDDAFAPGQLPHDAPALRAMAELGRAAWGFVCASRALLDAAPSVRGPADEFRRLPAQNAFWQSWRRTLVSEAQMMCVAADQTTKALGIERVEPMEMEALTIVAGVRPVQTELTEEGRSTDAWKNLLDKVREDLVGALANNA
jgi:uncharacterized protein (UPF0335 family)